MLCVTLGIILNLLKQTGKWHKYLIHANFCWISCQLSQNRTLAFLLAHLLFLSLCCIVSIEIYVRVICAS